MIELLAFAVGVAVGYNAPAIVAKVKALVSKK